MSFPSAVAEHWGCRWEGGGMKRRRPVGCSRMPRRCWPDSTSLSAWTKPRTRRFPAIRRACWTVFTGTPQGIPPVAAFFGLSDTTRILRRCGLSGFARGRVVTLQPPPHEDSARAIRDVFGAYGFTGVPEDRESWAGRLAELSQGWPRTGNCRIITGFRFRPWGTTCGRCRRRRRRSDMVIRWLNSDDTILELG